MKIIKKKGTKINKKSATAVATNPVRQPGGWCDKQSDDTPLMLLVLVMVLLMRMATTSTRRRQ